MTDKEFRKLKRSDLISIIYEYQKRQDELVEENKDLREQLDSKNLKISNSGSIAEAVVGLDLLFETAQKTADDYIEQVKAANTELERRAEERATEIIENARKEAEKILSEAKRKSRGK
ncbi:hypothetical protein [Ruminococcus flavefaciens]|uniref:Uncharacterized protein n=1 Tax=Ruminococcus flavefaciens 007c TaxID=1341157 RepID=W7UD79_RUMFL|nr:hypothetical protein [Ruminococcus flavefaciens]EWM53036.1 hypothetical protein RF007C_15600 [Ruminococcus flavefaciens 007c]